MPVLVNLVEHVGGHHAHDPLGEIHHLGPSEDEDEPQGGEGVERTGAESDYGEAKDGGHTLTPLKSEGLMRSSSSPDGTVELGTNIDPPARSRQPAVLDLVRLDVGIEISVVVRRRPRDHRKGRNDAVSIGIAEMVEGRHH